MSSITTVLIDCEAKSWAAVEFESFDERGQTVEKQSSLPTAFYAVPNWAAPRGPKLLCEHVRAGVPLEEMASS